MIRCESLSLEYGGDRGSPHSVLCEVSLEVASGELLLVRGASGSGKSTLLSILAAVRRPTSGQFLVDEHAVSRFTSPHRDLYRRGLGYLPQGVHLLDELTAHQNVALAAARRPATPDSAFSAECLLETLGLSAKNARIPVALSGGERQRVGIARALASAPSILLLDEPTSQQDDKGVDVLVTLLRMATQRNAHVVVTSHDARLRHALGPVRELTLSGGRVEV